MCGGCCRPHSAFAGGLGFWVRRGSKDVETICCDERTGQLPPLSGGRVPHFVQDQVQILDHVPVAVSVSQAPGVQEVISRLPH